MSQNPFAASNVPPSAPNQSNRREDIKSIAIYQKGIIVCILVYILAIVGQFLVPPEMRVLVGAAVLVDGLVGAVFVFLLAIKINGPGVGILYGVLSLIPCIGLIILLVVNSQATTILKENGISVGLLGANISKI